MNQQQRFAKRILDYFAPSKPNLAVWGLAFKARTDDVRESPAINCIKKFLENGFRIKAYDPEAGASALAVLNGKIELMENGYDVLDNANALVIFTDWQEFRNPDFALIKSKMKKPLIFDGRNLYNPEIVQKAGIEYHSIGRPSVSAKC